MPEALRAADSLADLALNMGCERAADGEAPDLSQAPDAAVCAADQPACDQLCAADSEALTRCTNEHLLLDSDRQAVGARVVGDKIIVTATVSSRADAALTCQFVTALKGYNVLTPDNVIYITGTTETVAIGPEDPAEITWVFRKSQFGSSNAYDASRARITGTCVAASDAPSGPKQLAATCDPFKRHECNWVVSH